MPPHLAPMSSSPAASITILPVDRVCPAMWEEVWQLTSRFYEADRSYVEGRLKAHDRVALFRDDRDQSLIGMAAIQVDSLEYQGRKLLVIFTSHGIVDEAYRGQNLLQRTGMRTYLASCLRHPLRRKFWAFDTFSYKSYLLLPRNLREFWPRRELDTPAWEAAFMDHYARFKYGDAWRDGLVQRSPQKRLLPQTASLDARLLQNPDLAFFARSNPEHAQGDMLFCLCPLTMANWWGILSNAAARFRRRR
jgi:hypothetical protein